MPSTNSFAGIATGQMPSTNSFAGIATGQMPSSNSFAGNAAGQMPSSNSFAGIATGQNDRPPFHYFGRMQKWLCVLVVWLVQGNAVAQESDSFDPEKLPGEWATKRYIQADKIYNRAVWTFADNPALAGFDRKLNVAYAFKALNLSQGIGVEGKTTLANWNHTANIDFAFGGTKKNWGTGLHYMYKNAFYHKYQRIQWAHSYRIMLGQHHILLGHAIGIQLLTSRGWNTFTFGDMIDPRFGYIYVTQEVRPSNQTQFVYMSVGMRYNWRRLSVDYAYQHEPYEGLAFSQTPIKFNFHRLKAVYHIYVGDEVTISPECVVFNNDLKMWRISPYVTITYRDMAFGQLGYEELGRLSFRAGYQFKDIASIMVGFSSFTDEVMVNIAGLASVDIGVRYQLNIRKK